LRPVTIEVVAFRADLVHVHGFRYRVDEFVIRNHHGGMRLIEKRGRRNADAGDGGQRGDGGDRDARLQLLIGNLRRAP